MDNFVYVFIVFVDTPRVREGERTRERLGRDNFITSVHSHSHEHGSYEIEIKVCANERKNIVN